MDKTRFDKIALDDRYHLYLSSRVEEFRLDQTAFQVLWDTHPTDFHEIRIHGKWVKTPRWQQAYGKNYRYTGSRNNALPIPDKLKSFLEWSQKYIDARLNGLLLNWYDGTQSHYIGAHRDDTRSHLKNILCAAKGPFEDIFRCKKRRVAKAMLRFCVSSDFKTSLFHYQKSF